MDTQWQIASRPEINVRVERLASNLGFSTEIVPRIANLHSGGKINAKQEHHIRSILPDNAEFILPIFWSQTEFVGVPCDSNSSALDFISRGIYEIGKCHRKPGYETGERYLRSVVSGVALQANRLRRQGFFVIGRKSISIVGAVCDFVSNPDLSYLSARPDEKDHWRFMEMPPDWCNIEAMVNIPFSELGEINTIELCRFDGLAEFLSFKEDRFLAKHISKRLEKIGRNTEDAIETLTELSNEYPQEVRTAFGDKFEYLSEMFLHRGLNVVTGTGLTESTKPRLCLLNSALGAVINDSRNGVKYFLESPFSELEMALSILPNAMSSANEIPEPPTHQISNSIPDDSFTAEVRKLNELRVEGLLSDDEFAAAKSALLRKLDK